MRCCSPPAPPSLHSFPTRRSSDLSVVQRWIEKSTAEGASGVSITPAQTINHVDTYLDTEDRRLDRAGYSVDRKSTRLNSSHVEISYAVFCLKKKIIILAI